MKTFLAKWRYFLVIIVAGFLLSACSPEELKNKAGLQIMTNDVPVSVFLDEHFLGQTPYVTKDLKPGDYTLKIVPENQQLVSYETSIKLRRGLLTVVTWTPGPTLAESGGVIYELEKLANRQKTEIAVLSIPDGAIISLDQASKIFAPFTSENELPGKHRFEATLPSYVTQSHNINLDKGYRLNILVKLAKDNLIRTEPVVLNEPNPSPNLDRRTMAEVATSAGQVQGTATTSSVPLRTAPPNIDLSQKKVLIKSTGYIENNKEVLKVRSSPNNSGVVIGLAETGKTYLYLDEQKAGWLKLEVNHKPGWVSAQYAQVQP